jgi:hypothetical protein
MNSLRSKDGTSIAFDRAATGPARILVGGAFQHRAIDPRTAHLAEHFTVFHYDRRGRGDTVEDFLTAAVSVPAEIVAQMRYEPMWQDFEAVAHTLAYDTSIAANTVTGSPTPLSKRARVTFAANVHA